MKNECHALFQGEPLIYSVDILKNITNSTECDHILLFKQKKEQLLKKFNNDLVNKLKTNRYLTTLEHEFIERQYHSLDELKSIAINKSTSFEKVKPSVYHWLYFGV